MTARPIEVGVAQPARESWLPPFSLERRYERDREGTGRFE